VSFQISVFLIFLFSILFHQFSSLLKKIKHNWIQS
jgi:hypothetical protein